MAAESHLPDRSAADAAIRKAARRLLPFLLLMYVLAFLDRANLGFAKQAFLADTGLSEAAYAFGAGAFFIGYALFEVPSNLVMHRVGARWWMCRIMVTWGLISAAMAWAESEWVFYGLRFLLGVAEAGFFPGVIVYLTWWFPARVRGRMIGIFYFGAPLALILGGPLSGALLELDGALGWKGWQWMFAVEGLLAAAVGVWVAFYLDNRPEDAAWLGAGEKAALAKELAVESAHRPEAVLQSLVTSLARPRSLHFAAVYFLIQVSVYGVTFYLPAQVAGLLGADSGWTVGVVSAVPWVCALAAAAVVPGWAGAGDRRRWVGAGVLAAGGFGIALSATHHPVLGLAGLCLAASGFIAAQPVFWTFPTREWQGATAAGGVALVNSCGALGGFLAPNLRVWADARVPHLAGGLFALAAATLIAAALMAALGSGPQRKS